MTKKKINKFPRWIKIIVWVFGILVGLILIFLIGFKIWTLTWKTYRNDEFGFSFRYPKTWYITPEIVSKKNFDEGNFSHGDFGGFIFYVDPKKGPLHNSDGVQELSPGDVEVSFYKKDISEKYIPGPYQKTEKRFGSKVGYEQKSLNSIFVTVITDKYIFDIAMRSSFYKTSIFEKPKIFYAHCVGETILNTFKFD